MIALIERAEWHDHAACRGVGPETFFAKEVADAIAICNECSVRVECLDWAISHPTESRCGVWGGMSERARRAERRRRGLSQEVSFRVEAACGTYSGYQRHKRLGQHVCDECRAARLVHDQQARALL